MDDDGSPWFHIGKIYHYFGYPNRRAALRAIRKGSFPCSTYIVSGRRRVIDKEVFYDFFRRNRQDGLEQLEEWEH